MSMVAAPQHRDEEDYRYRYMYMYFERLTVVSNQPSAGTVHVDLATVEQISSNEVGSFLNL